jgi:hypothetical protein
MAAGWISGRGWHHRQHWHVVDPNPIENAFAKLKAFLRETAARSIDALWLAIGRIIDLFTPKECLNYFKAEVISQTDWKML